MTDIFISYSRRDTVFVEQLYIALHNEGLSVWVDWEGIPPSAEWLREIFQAIDAADNIIFVISETFCRSDICQQELQYAIKQNKRLIPIVIEDLPGKLVPPSLANLNWLFFREQDAFDAALQTLLHAINTDLNWVRTHTQLLNKAVEWDNKARDNGLLLRGKELVSSEGTIAANQHKEPALTKLQQYYVQRGRQYASQRKRLFTTIATLLIAVIAAISWFGYQQSIQKEAERQAKTIREAGVIAGEAQRLSRDQGILRAIAATQLLVTVTDDIDPLVHNILVEKAGAYRFEPRATPHKADKSRSTSFGKGTERLTFTTDNKLLAAATNSEVIRRWVLCPDQPGNALCNKKPTKDLVLSMPRENPRRSMVTGFNRQGTRAVVADGRQISIYTLGDTAEVQLQCSQALPLDNVARRLSIHDNGQWIAIPYGSRWEHRWLINSACDGDKLTSEGFAIESKRPQQITATAFHPSQPLLYISYADGKLVSYHLENHTIQPLNTTVALRSFDEMRTSSDGRWLAANNNSGVSIIDLQSKDLATYQPEQSSNPQRRTALQFNHSATRLALHQQQNNIREIRLLDIGDPENIRETLRFNIPYQQHAEPNVRVRTLAFSHDDQWLAAGLEGDNYDIMLWPLATQQLIELACSRLQDKTLCPE